MGDFNINLPNCNINKNTSDYVDTLYSCAFFPTINPPTWITDNSKILIDNTFYNDATKNVISENVTTWIPDHLTLFILISNQNTSSKNQMLNTDEKRSFRNIDSMAFEEDLKRINWNQALTLSEENPNFSFKIFLINTALKNASPKPNVKQNLNHR